MAVLLIAILSLVLIVVGLLLVVPSTKGWAGEKMVAILLRKFSPKDAIIINDLYFHNGILSCQIDHLVISEKGIFVIETKNYLGTSEGRVMDQKILRKVLGMRYYMKNPVMQNDYHIRYLMENIPGLRKYGYAFHSIIVFVMMSKLRFRGNSSHLGYPCEIIKLGGLVKHIWQTPSVLSREQCQLIYGLIKKHNRRRQ